MLTKRMMKKNLVKKKKIKINAKNTDPESGSKDYEADYWTKNADTEKQAGDEDEDQPQSCDLRTIGTVIFVVGNLVTFASFAFAPQSLLAGLESVQFLSNILFVKYMHKQEITQRMILATFGIFIGCILVVVFAEHTSELFTSDDMINLYKTNTGYHAYLVVAFVLWVANTLCYRYYYHIRCTHMPASERKLLYGHTFIEQFTYSTAAAIGGAQAVLNSKCMAILLKVSSTGEKNEFKFWWLWFILSTWILLVVYWVNRIDTGLKYYDPQFIIPVLQVFFIFFAIVVGGIYFQEFAKFSTGQYIGFSAGVLLILSGVYGLAPVDVPLKVITEDEPKSDDTKSLMKTKKPAPYNKPSGKVAVNNVVDETLIKNAESLEHTALDQDNKELPKSNSKSPFCIETNDEQLLNPSTPNRANRKRKKVSRGTPLKEIKTISKTKKGFDGMLALEGYSGPERKNNILELRDEQSYGYVTLPEPWKSSITIDSEIKVIEDGESPSILRVWYSTEQGEEKTGDIIINTKSKIVAHNGFADDEMKNEGGIPILAKNNRFNLKITRDSNGKLKIHVGDEGIELDTLFRCSISRVGLNAGGAKIDVTKFTCSNTIE